ncbi:MAG: anti-sigma factor [Winogradskyella sp.]|uniref:anti-sigma factor n=1 Tax=Winogradskyella sp. TaxID=1883156 RepID=UPI00180A1532|nr:anti-sigma factor [Winogradskyella sp.]MBT8244165.1 anti-sigma factor [Winogradskyella sp.]NNK23450.1 anti-sigma factor [Winogradskyella sp.]
MMTKKELLENGLLEQYVLGELDAKQTKAVEQLLLSDTELKTKLEEIESNFENLAMENAINPPAFIKTKLLSNIKVSNNKTISESGNSNKFWLGIAASVAAFFLLGSVWLFTELNTLKEDLRVVGNQNEVLQKNLDGITKNYDEVSNWYAALSNPDAEQYILKGNTLSPEAKIVSFVNHENKSVVINTKKLPQLDADHDYQMWADVDGEMINMGVIPKNKELIAMTYVNDAESLNITIEPAGGNDHPTVERLISNVYLN